MKEDVGKGALVATGSQTVGPFFHFALTTDRTRGTVAHISGSERIELAVRVTDGDDEPVTDAMVELWQTGNTSVHGQSSGGTEPRLWEFGRMPTGEDGTCVFNTVRPGPVADTAGATQAAHINICLFARGLLRQLHTRAYFADDPALDGDPVMALVPKDRRATLVAVPDSAHSGRWLFHVRLQGFRETVFFDV